MPPLPSTPEDLHAAIARRLEDIESYQVPRLTKCRGPIGLQREMADETKSDLEEVRRNIEICKELTHVLRPAARADNEVKCRAFENRYKQLHLDYRRAVLASKATVSSSSRHLLQDRSADINDDLPDAGPSQPSRAPQASMADDALQTRTNEVTDALRRTTTTMQAELERSVLSVQMLEDSTRTLRSTANLYDTYTSLLEASGNLIKQLERADWWDRLVILAAFMFFLLCVGWIIKRRVLDRVVGGVGWWVGGSFKLIGMGLGMGRGKAAGGGDGSGVGQVGAGQIGRTPAGMGRVGLAGGNDKRGKGELRPDDLEPPGSVLDSIVPSQVGGPGDSAVRAPPVPVVKDEL